MGDPSVRAMLLAAMRESRWNEHKLVFQEFAATPEGQQLVRVAATSSGVQPSMVEAWIAQLPSLDFYVPVREQRARWDGADNVVVGLNLDVDDPTLTGYTPRGEVVRLDRRNGIPVPVVFLLHPAEPKYVRSLVEGSSVAPLAVIDPTEIDPGGGGTVGGGGGSTGGSSSGSILKSYVMYVDDGWGDNEILFKHYSDKNVQNKIWEWVDSGAYYGQGEIVNKSTTLGSSSTVIRVWERDSGFPETGSDDYIGGGFLTNYSTTGDMVLTVRASCNPPYYNDYTFLQYCNNTVGQGDMIGTIIYDPQ